MLRIMSEECNVQEGLEEEGRGCGKWVGGLEVGRGGGPRQVVGNTIR